MTDPTQRLNPITHPTVVVRRVVRAAERQEARPGLHRFFLRAGFTAGLFGVLLTVYGAAVSSTGGVVLGVGIFAAGGCLVALEELLPPDSPSWDERVAGWVRKRVGK